MAQYTQEEILASLRDAHRRLEERSSLQHDPIAIIGMSCRFPGGVTSPAGYWQLLREGRSGIVWFSEDELRATGADTSAYGRSDYVRAGAVLEDIEYFDNGFFGLHPKDLELMDPQHRLLLQGVWEALEDAGYGSPENRGDVGLFGGCSINHYFLEQLIRNEDFKDADNFQITTGNEKDYLVSKIAYLLNLRGPVVNVQSACSTSLVAAHYAVQSLRLGECDMAVAGGATVKVPHRTGYLYHPDSIRSSGGECRAFDAQADGTVEGNGMGLVVLKPLRRALKDRDHIYAVIKGSAVNNDGDNKVNFAAPSVQGQEQVIVKALENARINPETIQYFEAHGTGTKVGDPIEVAAAAKAFSRWTKQTGYCALGSVKSNIGHADAAAGVAGLMKATLSLYHREIPPTLHFTAPNPALSLPGSPFHVNATLRKWPEGSPRRAAVSAFGIGGTNSHMVLEESPEIPLPEYERKHYVLPISAKTADGLSASEQRLKDFLSSHGHMDLANVAYTLAVGRKAFSHRSVIVARDAGECIAQLAKSTADRGLQEYQDLRNVPVVFLFPGQGSELSENLGKELYETERSYRECVNLCLSAAKDRLNVNVDRHLGPSSNSGDGLDSQLRLFIVEYALATMWMANGVRPAYLVGHGLGEYAAACLAGVMSISDAMWMVAKRAEAIASLTSVAALEAFGQSLRGLQLKPARIPLLPSVTGQESTPDGVLSARYWVDQLRGSVHLAGSIAAILQKSNAVFLEVGPGTALTEQVRGFDSVVAKNCVPSLPASRDEQANGRCISAALATLWLRGVNVEWERFYAGIGTHRIPLPTYPFEKHRYWVDKRQPAPGMTERTRSEPAAMQAGEELYYVPTWKRVPFIQKTPIVTQGTCLFFDDDSLLAKALKASASTSGFTTVIVSAGRQFARTGPSEYHIDAQNEDDYARLMQELVAQDLVPKVVLHLWGQQPEVRDGNGSSRTDCQPDAPGFWSLCSFVKAWTRLGISAPVHAGVLSSNVENVSGSEPIDPQRSLVLGGCQAIQHELPNSRCHHFDIALGNSPSWQTLKSLSASILSEVVSDHTAMRVAYRGPTRWVMDLEAIQLPDPPAHETFIREGGVYWITGGQGGIGLELADFLTQKAQVTLVLIQRGEFPERKDWSTWLQAHAEQDRVSGLIQRMTSVESRGSRIVVERADVTDIDRMHELYEKTLRDHGALNGIIHAAGVPGGGLLALKSDAEIRAVWAPKVLGTQAIQAALGSHPLDFFVLCSSVTALAGGPGRSDYCAANCFLDAFATECHRSGSTRVLSINWDAWSETGMASTYRKKRWERAGEPNAGEHPLLESVIVVDDKTTVYRTVFSEAKHWIARDHRIFGMPTIPGAAYIEMIAAALLTTDAQLEIRDLRFIQPLALASGGSTAFMEVEEKNAEYSIRVLSVDPASPDQSVLHAQASAVLVREQASRKIELERLKQRLLAVDLQGWNSESDGSKQDGALQLGPAWDINVESVHAGEQELLACLQLPETVPETGAGGYLHVSLFDIATSYAMRYLSQGQLYLPVSYEKLHINAPMPRRIYSHVKYAAPEVTAPEIMKLDISVLDTDGHELISITRFAVKKVSDKAGQQRSDAAMPAASSGAIGQRPYGLSTANAVRAFSRAISAQNLPQIVVAAAPLHETSVSARASTGVSSSPSETREKTKLRPRPDLPTPYVEPADDMEKRLVQIWQATLGVEPIGVNDDYMDLGGDSLIATRLVDKVVAELNVSLSIVTLYDQPTVRELAKALHESLPASATLPGQDRDAALVRKSQARREFLNSSGIP